MSNEDLLKWFGRELRASWIEQRTGIKSRHWVQADQACSDLGVEATRNLVADFKVDLAAIRQIILGTESGDYITPPTSPLIAYALKMENCGAIDLTAASAGFVSGLQFAASMALASGQDQLLINSEVRSKFLSKDQFNSAVLFGDGASACAITIDSKNTHFRLVGSQLSSDGRVSDLISIPAGGSRMPFQTLEDPLGADRPALSINMKDGAAVFAKAVQAMQESADQLLAALHLKMEDIDWIVPHQANGMILKELEKRIPGSEGKVIEVISMTGNTSGASVGIALSHLLHGAKQKGSLKNKAKVLLVSAGGGLAASAVLEARN
jgi:3-oxoacyl-[acyl-carrier-protein] synthase-3